MTDPTQLCFGCFIETATSGPCSRCGYDREERVSEFPMALLPGSVLSGKYLVGGVLGKPGGFGITYLGYELNLQARVAIKEYVPRDLVTRHSGDGASVVPHSGEDGDHFRYGLEGFLEEARTLAKLDHRNIVEVRDYFGENNTAYLVMKFYEGESLGERLSARGGRLPADELLAVTTPILDALKEVHDKGLLHRDIKPANIYVTGGGRPILLDFGAARQAMGERSRSLSSVLTPGYAPFEQYHRKGNQGPWTDIYAIAATMYRAVTGTAPPEANERLAGEPLLAPRSIDPEIPVELESAILWGLELEVQERPQDVVAFKGALAGEARPSADQPRQSPGAVDGAEGAGSAPERRPVAVPDSSVGAGAGAGKKGKGRRLIPLLIGGGVIAGAVVGAAIFLSNGDGGLDPRDRLFEVLTDLSRSQGTFLTANGTYASDADELGLSPDPDLTVEIQAATALGWTATASLTGYQEVCSIFIGDATPPPHAAQPGVVGCGPDPANAPDVLARGPDIDPAQDTAGAGEPAGPTGAGTDEPVGTASDPDPEPVGPRTADPEPVLPDPEPEPPEPEVPVTTLAGGFAPDPHVLTLTAGGPDSASTVGSAACVGYVDRAPDVALVYSNPASYLSFFADSDTDLTLMVRSPEGGFSCDDDSSRGGTDPLVELRSPTAGRYEIWVGTYHAGTSPAARLEISGIEIPVTTLVGGFTPDPHVLNLTAGGPLLASSIGPSECLGYVDGTPDAVLAYSTPASYLSIFADSDTDLTLMVRSPSGVFSCNDDSPRGGLDPLVELASPIAGPYQIWIGTLGSGTLPAARLEISGIGGPVTTLVGGFTPDPRILNLTAGGPVRASTIGPSECLGYVDRGPDAVVDYSNPRSYLSIFADSDTDLTLMVRSPAGVFSCNDDSRGNRPLVEFDSPTAGRYEIWIGTYSEGPSTDARLDISELRNNGGD